ncbi:hypothetical protein FRB97_003624 [Tulasnella sp. 331]|nr:hypothetical protein FRB97_003624 [Tulasnella sp. 331]
MSYIRPGPASDQVVFQVSTSFGTDESMDEGSENGTSGEEYSDAVMESISVVNSELSASTLFPYDSISQRGINPLAPVDPVDQPAVHEVHSFHQSDGEHLFKHMHGRTFTSQSDDYCLPADDEEHMRLDIQHNMLKYHLGALYPCSTRVEWLLRPGQNVRPGVLDVGTGSGRWPLDMAREFPHADVIGIDLVPPVLLDASDIPENCRFEVDDANLSMSHHSDSFDVVHARAVEGGIHDYDGFLYEVAQTLRPGGLVILVSGMPQLLTEDFIPFPVTEPGEEGFCWTQKLFYHAYETYHRRGNFSVDAGLHFKRYLENNPNYEDVQQSFTFIGIGAWQKDLTPVGAWVAEAMKNTFLKLWHSFKPMLLNNGYEPDLLDSAKTSDVVYKADLSWITLCSKEATKELLEQTIHAKIPWRYCTATRKDIPWQERTETPDMSDLGSEAPTLIVKPSPRGTKSVVAKAVGIGRNSDHSGSTERGGSRYYSAVAEQTSHQEVRQQDPRGRRENPLAAGGGAEQQHPAPPIQPRQEVPVPSQQHLAPAWAAIPPQQLVAPSIWPRSPAQPAGSSPQPTLHQPHDTDYAPEWTQASDGQVYFVPAAEISHPSTTYFSTSEYKTP